MTLQHNTAERQEAPPAAQPRLVGSNSSTPLHADRDIMHKFFTTIFKHCQGDKGHLVFRAFEYEKNKVCLNQWTPFAKCFVDEAVKAATEIARRTGKHRAVFSPPICIFGDQETKDGKRFSGESNVVSAPAIQVDLDKHPTASLIELWNVLGQPTLVVNSGGVWEGEDKLHAYWRLGEPARSEKERALLKRARAMASMLVDGDDTAAALSHPMRLPGSWHTKSEPRLCRITDDGDADREIKLEWAVEELSKALAAKGEEWKGRSAFASPGTGQFKTKEPLSPETLADAARIIPNDDLGWEAWNTIAMTFYDASHGSLEGYEALSEWSQKSLKYTPEGVEERWAHYPSSPPTEVSAGKLFHLIREVEPGYKQRPDLPAIWHEPSDPVESPAPAAAAKSIAEEAGVDDASAPTCVRDLNKRHAFVMNKGKAFVANLNASGEVTFSLKSSFFDQYANQLIRDGRREVSKAELWWASPHRAQFTGGVDFDPEQSRPGVFNMWRGFPAVRASANGSCELILRHIREVICNGVQRDFDYLIRWLAHILQQPADKPGVAVVLRGAKGTGKDTLGEYMGEILQHLYFMVADQILVTGAFNNHMTSKLLLHVQEAIWAGNKQAESALKSMITAPEMAAHPKGIDAFMVKSFMRVLMSSNEDWVVPASADERRFFVLNVSPDRIHSAEWFNPIRAEMHNGGPAAFAKYLRSIDLTGFDVRRPHKTDALREQQQASLADFPLFWSELIEDGTALPGAEGGSWEDEHARVKIDDLIRRYDDWRKNRKFSKAIGREEAGRRLKEFTKDEVQPAQVTIDGFRVAVRVLPPAARCRELWGQRCAL